MKTLNPYLNFAGNCEEALNFYQQCFNGKIETMKSFSEAGMDVPENWKDKICHAEFRVEDIYFMASDGMDPTPIKPNNAVTLSINFTDLNEQETIFNALAEGGNIIMPLKDTFWNARFGMLADKFGVNWMFNCDL